MTVGGAISGGITGPAASKHGTIADAVERMEVVLANGDLIETSRISRREVDRKKASKPLRVKSTDSSMDLSKIIRS